MEWREEERGEVSIIYFGEKGIDISVAKTIGVWDECESSRVS